MASGRRRGVTLLEMIVVITIFAMLLGMSVAILKNANRDLGVNAASLHVVALLRGAHQFSRGTSSPAWVVFSLRENSVHMLVKETIGEWHLEDLVTTGAFGKNGQVSGATLVRGRVGQGLLLSGSGTINCGEIPVFAPDQGIAVELWFLRRPSAGKQVLATVGQQVELYVEGDGRLGGKVGGLTVLAGDRIPPDAWCHVQLIYAVGELKLFVNNTLLARRVGETEWTRNSPLIFGATSGGLVGILDEARVSIIVPGELYLLPSEAVFHPLPPMAPDASGRYVVHFRGDGRLDPQFHTEAILFGIKSPSDSRYFEVGLGGALVQKPPPTPPPADVK